MINISILKNAENVVWLKAEDEYYLFSYETLVCYIDRLNDVKFLNQDKHSKTTAKHIAEFIKHLKIGNGNDGD